MKKLAKIIISLIALAFAGALIFVFFFAASLAERLLNPVVAREPYQISPRAADLHEKLLVADLHADSLLWNRDLNIDSPVAHVDVPKLRRGNVALQAFTVVTKSPRGLNIEKNSGDTDDIFWLALAQRQPLENLSSLTKRALYQAAKLHEYAAASQGTISVIKTKRDLKNFLEKRGNQRAVGGWLGIEGAHALDGKIENVDVLFDAGFRMMAPSHFFDTEIGGSAHGVEKYGLTELGNQVIKRMEEKGMMVDLAHASPKTIDDVLAMATKPAVVSHTGVRGTCDNQRNLSDDQLRRIAATGGVIGIGFWDTAVCGTDARAVGRAIRYATNIAGVRSIALGSDFDGSVTAPFDASGVPLITEALIAEGFSDNEIALIMGGNVLRVMSDIIPE